MDLNKKCKITNTSQFTRMVELLEQNPSLARGYSSGVNKVNVKEEWNKVGAQLNILGHPTRTGEGWAKVWADYKFKIKKKLVHNKAECHATGGGSFKQFVLSPTEDAAANLLQMNSIVNPAGFAFGIRRTITENDVETDISMDEIVENEEPICSKSIQKTPMKPTQNNDALEEANASQSTKKKKTPQNNELSEERSFLISNKKTPTKKTSKNDLLEEQLRVQTSLYTEVHQSLAEIKRYQRKNYHLKVEKLKLYKEELRSKKEKLKLYKEDLKSKKEYRRELLKLRKEEIEIERRRIELDELRNGIQR